MDGAIRQARHLEEELPELPSQQPANLTETLNNIRSRIVREFAAPEVSESTADDPADRDWTAIGQVTDENGQPMEGVEVNVHTGIGTLRRTGTTTTDEAGRYQIVFQPGVLFSGGDLSSVRQRDGSQIRIC